MYRPAHNICPRQAPLAVFVPGRPRWTSPWTSPHRGEAKWSAPDRILRVSVFGYCLNPFVPLRAYFARGLGIARHVCAASHPSNEGRPVKHAFDMRETALELIAIKSSFRLRIIVPITGAYFAFVN
jgi:hypothetical protein